MASDTGVPCFSSLSLDRSTAPDSLVTTEYFSDQTMHGRLYRYPLNSAYLLAVDGHWYVANSYATTNGQLWDETTTSAVSSHCNGTSAACWAMHPRGADPGRGHHAGLVGDRADSERVRLERAELWTRAVRRALHRTAVTPTEQSLRMLQGNSGLPHS